MSRRVGSLVSITYLCDGNAESCLSPHRAACDESTVARSYQGVLPRSAPFFASLMNDAMSIRLRGFVSFTFHCDANTALSSSFHGVLRHYAREARNDIPRLVISQQAVGLQHTHDQILLSTHERCNEYASMKVDFYCITNALETLFILSRAHCVVRVEPSSHVSPGQDLIIFGRCLSLNSHGRRNQLMEVDVCCRLTVSETAIPPKIHWFVVPSCATLRRPYGNKQGLFLTILQRLHPMGHTIPPSWYTGDGSTGCFIGYSR